MNPAMERLNIVDSRDHLATRGIILAKSRFQSFHVSSHSLNGRTESSSQPSPHIHPSVNLAQNLHTTMPAISNYSFCILPVRVQVQHLFILIELLRLVPKRRRFWRSPAFLHTPSAPPRTNLALCLVRILHRSRGAQICQRSLRACIESVSFTFSRLFFRGL